MRNLWPDLRYAARVLARSPGFTLVAVLTLALGIGANTAIFSVANAVLLRPVPANHPEEMVRIERVDPQGRRSSRHSYLDYSEFREQHDVLSGALASNLAIALLRTGETTEQLLGEVVSGNYFDVLGTKAQVGRLLTESDDQRGAAPVVVISHRIWRQAFGGRTDVLGQSVSLNGSYYTIVGVVPERFNGLFPVSFSDFWAPVMQASAWVAPDALTSRDAQKFLILTRLRPGVERAAAESALRVVAARLADQYPETNRGVSAVLLPARMLEGQLRSGATMLFSLLLAVAGLVLLAGCSNLAALLLVRTGARRREMAVRVALGATRGRLMAQLLTENLLLGVLAGTAGLVVGRWASDLLLGFNPLPDSIPLRLDLTLDARVLLFTMTLSILATAGLAFFPALQSARPAVLGALKEETAGAVGGRGRTRLRSLFVVAQVTVSLVLLVVSGLFLRSLKNAASIDLGFSPERTFATDIELKSLNWSEEKERRFYRDLLERVERLPGVRAAALSDLTPLDLAVPHTAVRIEGVTPPPGQESIAVSLARVTPGYFDTVGISLVAGRGFTPRDDSSAPPVVVVNQSMATRYWPGQNPLGQSFRLVGDARVQPATVAVVGVARDSKYRTLGEEPTPHIYLSNLQQHAESRTLLVRTQADPGPVILAVQREMEQLNPRVQGFFTRTLSQQVALALVPARLTAAISLLFGFLALLLATIGLYGLVAYSVLLRTREIGIRIAMGAQRLDILRLMLGHGGKLITAGTVLGLVVAWALANAFGGLLYGVSATDPATFAVAAGLLTLVALCATWVPANRATRVDPVVTLRSE